MRCAYTDLLSRFSSGWSMISGIPLFASNVRYISSNTIPFLPGDSNSIYVF